MERLKKLLYPNGVGKKEYRNMVGQDHLIESAKIPVPKIKECCRKVLEDPSFDINAIPYNELVEYQICYFIIGLSRITDFVLQLDFIYKNAYIAKSWMTTDLCNQYLIKPNITEYKNYFLKLIKLNGTYERRFAYVIALKMAKDINASRFFLENIIDDDRYYALMAEAWLIAEIGIYHFDLVKTFLEMNGHLVELKRKAISKMIDSYRISDENKLLLKEIRKKL